MNLDCPKCPGILIPAFDNDDILVNKCPLCGYTKENNEELKVKQDKNQEWFNNIFSSVREGIIKNDDKLIVISYLKSVRESRKVSQKQMAEIFRFTEQRYGNAERHYNAPSIVLICQFAYVLGVSPGELYKTVLVPKKLYDEMRYLKIHKSEIVPFEELKSAELKLNSISDKKSKEYVKAKGEYDKLINSTAMFLKQGELVENNYWEKYLKMKEGEEIINLIKE